MNFEGLVPAAALGYTIWWFYRMGYENGRAFELDAEARRLDAEAVRLKEQYERLSTAN
jgi:hypothetical protein